MHKLVKNKCWHECMFLYKTVLIVGLEKAGDSVHLKEKETVQKCFAG